MMNEQGKSDPAVVAAKLANKAERSAAEPVEPRAGTKGNANQQHSGRTQSRETVSQVLARIRQTARERKKERFTALFHHINVELLRDAFFTVRREAAPGVDRVTWQDYQANVETNLQDLHARVQRGAYRALPSRRRTYPSRMAGSARSRSTQSHRTTLRSRQPLGSAEVTHPFHPLRGHRFVVLKVRRVSGVDTLSLRHSELGSFAMPREWTDWAPPNAEVTPAGV